MDSDFEKDIKDVINKHGIDSKLNISDTAIASFLVISLDNFEKALPKRDREKPEEHRSPTTKIEIETTKSGNKLLSTSGTVMINTTNLCDSCADAIPRCDPQSIIFGTGKGNDNIIACSSYQPDSDGEKVNHDGLADIVTGKPGVSG